MGNNCCAQRGKPIEAETRRPIDNKNEIHRVPQKKGKNFLFYIKKSIDYIKKS